MREFKWRVVPLCPAQLLDVNKSDILNGGLYRRCNTYKGGGGYDKFPAIYNDIFHVNRSDLNNQFVAQLYGCTLDCPYCYVTRNGVYGEYKEVRTSDLVRAFQDSGCSVFHLMGGAPAIYFEHWEELIRALSLDETNKVFHSDLMCVESEYSLYVLKRLTMYKNALYAVSIKGATEEEFYRNTRTKLNSNLFWRNMDRLVTSGLKIYLTFTGMAKESIEVFENEIISRYGSAELLENSFAIQLVHYKALDYKMF